MVNQTFKVTVQGPETDISRDVSEEQALKVISIVLGTVYEPTPSSENSDDDATESTSNNQGEKSDLSIGEFIESLKIEGNDDRIAAIALFLSETRDQHLFTKDELSGWFRAAGEKVPGNIQRDLSKATSDKIIAQDPNDSNSYYLTKTGKKKLRNSE